MLRRALVEKAPEVVNGFRMRGTQVSRLEAFFDCVFGFALTLLVVSTAAPQDYQDLLRHMRALIPFAFCFAIFFGIWSQHYTYCRRYGLEDFWVRALTVGLLFVVLIYVYPLRFLALFIASAIFKLDVGWKPDDSINSTELMVIYGVGGVAIELVLFLFYLHAYRQREVLRLDELETLNTKWWTLEHMMVGLIPLTSIVVALIVPERQAGLAGFVYFGMGFVHWFHGSMHGRRHRALVKKMELEGRLSASEMNTENDLVEVTAR